MNKTTKRYVDGLLNSDEEVIKELYSKLYPKVKRYVLSARGNEDDALDVLEQNCFDLYIEKFNQLSENCKEILTLYFNGLNYEDIVSEKEYASVNTVRQRVFKCRTKLIGLIKADKQFLKIKRWR